MSYLRIISLQLPEIIFPKTHIIKHLAGDFLAHGVTFGDFMARNFLAGDFLTRIRQKRLTSGKCFFNEKL